MLLRSPAPLRSLRDLPFIGKLIHRLSHRIVPDDQKVWARVETGPARGLWLELNPRTGQNYLHGEVETTVQKILAERLRPEMVFYDLGANIGFFTLLAARLVGAGGRVFSFEPDPENAARLRRNVEHNSFSQVTVVESGVWSSTGTLEFTTAGQASPDRGVGTFLSSDAGAASTPIRVVSLDDFVRSAPPPDAIKCDVEGAEVHGLRGAERLLASYRPWILAEMHSDSNDRVSRELLSNFGYTVETIDSNHILALPG